MTRTPTPAQIRVMRAIERSGCAPSNTRQDLLNRLRDAGLIGPMADRNEPWRITKAGRAALKEEEGREACFWIAAACARIIG